MFEFNNRFKIISAVFLILTKDDSLLMMRRFQTGFRDGYYSLPAGHVDGEESLTTAVSREVKEEIDITLNVSKLDLVHVMHLLSTDPVRHKRLNFFFQCKQWQDTPQNCEPKKCDDLQWFPLKSLPVNTVPYVQFALDRWLSSQLYSEYGW